VVESAVHIGHMQKSRSSALPSKASDDVQMAPAPFDAQHDDRGGSSRPKTLTAAAPVEMSDQVRKSRELSKLRTSLSKENVNKAKQARSVDSVKKNDADVDANVKRKPNRPGIDFGWGFCWLFSVKH